MDGENNFRGVAVHQRQLFEIHGTLADFILDYVAYDPEIRQHPDVAEFRGGVLTVSQSNIPQFLAAMKARSITRQEANLLSGADSDLLAFIDFDSRRYVHTYYDLALEDYVPKGWKASLGNAPEELRAWSSKN